MRRLKNMLNTVSNITDNGSQGDCIIKQLKEIVEGSVNKVYNTKELCEYLNVGKSVIDKLRQQGEISYSKVGQTYVFTQQDINDYLMRTKVKYVG